MSGSTSIVTTDTKNEQSQINGLAAVRGDNNTTQVLDAGAIGQAYQYAAKVNDNTTNNIGSVLQTIDSVTGKALQATTDASKQTISALQSGLSKATGSIQEAYTKAASSGLDPQNLLLGMAALAVVAIFAFRKG